MKSKNRRDFLRTAAQVAGSATALSMLPASIRNALAIPANNATGTIKDVEHIVVLMQENRSFDHYFGTLQGVRGFGDTRTIVLHNDPNNSGKPVWYQPNAVEMSSYVLPFRPSADNLGLQFLQDLPHDWGSTHQAWNGGLYDRWVPAKGTTTMAYLTREDIPFHYALADAFTICDAYHCSMMACTDPNRYYHWTGWAGNDGNGGGPRIDNSGNNFSWSTYPEALQNAGISWKIYQDMGSGDNPYTGNYTDNPLFYFNNYINAPHGTPLHDNAYNGTNVVPPHDNYFDQLKQDVQNNTLPQVSWIIAPEAYSEHPNWPANYGAWYIDQVLQTLTSNPEVWSKTVFLINYDENDGFFDHVSPPFPPASSTNGLSAFDTTNEFYQGEPYGLGPRVPMLVVSPWSKGGWVCSQVFDHTSVLRFIGLRFGVDVPNLTPWRQGVCGDLSSAFNFTNPNDALPTLPSTSGYVPPDQWRHSDYVPQPPTVQAIPKQEPDVRPTRPLPYALSAVVTSVDASQHAVTMTFANDASQGAVFLVYYQCGITVTPPLTYTVEGNNSLSATLQSSGETEYYDFIVYGPNGFLRRLAGEFLPGFQDVAISYQVPPGNIELTLQNHDLIIKCEFTIVSAYPPYETIKQTVSARKSMPIPWDLTNTSGWYDLSVTTNLDPHFIMRFAGHVETGQSSMSDPALGA